MLVKDILMLCSPCILQPNYTAFIISNVQTEY